MIYVFKLYLLVMENTINTVILDLEKQLYPIKYSVYTISLPETTIENTLIMIFSCISIAEEEIFLSMLRNISEDLCRGEGLYDNVRLNEQQYDSLMYEIVELGKNIRSEVKAYNLFEDGFFQFEYDCMLDNNTVVLKKIEDVY